METTIKKNLTIQKEPKANDDEKDWEWSDH
jgi:hypothetical protein